MGVNNAVMTETIEEGLDEVFYDSYSPEDIPNFANISDVFREKKSKKHAEYDLEVRGVGRFRSKGEEEDIFEDDIEEKYKTTYTHVEYANSVPISYAQVQDQLYGLIEENVGELGDAARDTQFFTAFSIFRNAFSASYLGADGKALCATDHPRDFGGVLNNKLTAKLSPTSLEAAIQSLAEQKSHSKRLIPNRPNILLVTPRLFPLAVQITGAESIPLSNNAGPNVFSSKYNIFVKQSPYFAAVEGGSDDYWFLLGKRNKLKRYIRQALMTWVTPWNQSRKMTTFYNAYYRESYGWSSPIGIVGSDGTTGSYP